MAFNGDSSFRVVVSGMVKKPVQRRGNDIAEEGVLGCFFRDHGCRVVGVRLVIDAKRNSKSRGFAFVDFEDKESLDLALKLHNREAKGFAEKDGKLRIEKARIAADEGRMRHQILWDAKYQTEELECKLAFHAARINELVRKAVQKQLNCGTTQEGISARHLCY